MVGSVVVGGESQLERGIGSRVHVRRGVGDLDTGETNAVLVDIPRYKRSEVGYRFGVFSHHVGLAQRSVSMGYGNRAQMAV